MDNQHRKIVGYRELSQEEIDLINRIKAKGAELLELHKETIKLIGKTDIQTGVMALVRAVAQPTVF